MKEIVITFVGALSTAVAGVLIAWLLARSRSGRLSRTFDQAGKVLDFIERYSAAYGGLEKLPEAIRPNVQKLLHETAQAIQEDFTADRSMLPEFDKTTSSFRKVLLLYVPDRTAIWIPCIVFHTSILFMLYVCIVRFVQASWEMADTTVLIFA